MPAQAPLRLVKRWRRYTPKAQWASIPSMTRGFYVLYERGRGKRFDVCYIGIAGTGRRAGIRSRIRSHVAKKPGWTHFSFFEVHDNISAGEIRELEALLLQIFRHDPRIKLLNVHKGSGPFSKARGRSVWGPQK